MGSGDSLNLLIERDVFDEDFTRFYVAEVQRHLFLVGHRIHLFLADCDVLLTPFPPSSFSALPPNFFFILNWTLGGQWTSVVSDLVLSRILRTNLSCVSYRVRLPFFPPI